VVNTYSGNPCNKRAVYPHWGGQGGSTVVGWERIVWNPQSKCGDGSRGGVEINGGSMGNGQARISCRERKGVGKPRGRTEDLGMRGAAEKVGIM